MLMVNLGMLVQRIPDKGRGCQGASGMRISGSEEYSLWPTGHAKMLR